MIHKNLEKKNHKVFSVPDDGVIFNKITAFLKFVNVFLTDFTKN